MRRTAMRAEGLGLRAGDWVEVRSKAEILKTLDDRGRLDDMPFMPEMFAYCGQRLRVYKSAHKTCDTIGYTGARSIERAVHLEGVRCDGSQHGGCQAACLIFWKEAWLNPEVRESLPAVAVAPYRPACSESAVLSAARSDGGRVEGPDATYVCQATELVRASRPLRWFDVRQYLKDYRTRNAKARDFLDGFVYRLCETAIKAAKGPKSRAGGWLVKAYDRVQAARGGRPFPRKRGTIPAGRRTPVEALGLKPGEWVRVKPYEEILKTLDTDNKNRGLYFDAEHVPFCNAHFRVRAIVDRIVDEKTGRMLHFKGASVILEGAWCQSGYSDRRLFCPRAIFPYWRELWLERIENTQNLDPSASGSKTENLHLPLVT
jgi:hypothetical protein